jgi:hypothetical protein
MIIGNVNANREAVITLTVLGTNQQRQEIKASSNCTSLGPNR